ncbi:MAG: hypothetical protein CVV64_16055 [Candidatus Wallbacteria bacterium HGW-Wallbacteria-1]|jgi:putative ABC transport system permease protein|uniref:ABC3 transporter permease C-terminal domain-containing protein n=1 Tax=Candidatus Wallbacteria bacterium HGW-Wallbacteria-1 TaxID=2013854 RepID=A0A2N1PL60_9BACT|nr:MAG: hypothetical protein CVV64_16055 [Candidatus Wallbacteria bacterium HGW-Wallbacteria-1]
MIFRKLPFLSFDMVKFISRGLIRDPSRSLFPVLVCCFGVAFTFVGSCFIDGMMNDFIKTSAYLDTGHIKIVSRAYGDEISIRPMDLSMETDDTFIAGLEKRLPGYRFTRRVTFGGLIDIPDETGMTMSQAPFAAFGMDLLGLNNPECAFTANEMKMKSSLRSGRFIEKQGEILLSVALAESLGIKPGVQATLFGSTMDGATASKNFNVVGTISFGISQMDRSTVIMDISDADNYLAMEGYTAEILAFRVKGHVRGAIAEDRNSFNAEAAENKDPYAPVALALEDQNNLRETLDITEISGQIIAGVFIFLMTLVLWNAGLINGLRRYSEIGMRLAIGEKRTHIIATMLSEALLTGLAGTLFGILMALPFALYLEKYGVDYSSEMKNISMMINSVMKAKVTLHSGLLAAVPGIFSSLAGMFVATLGIYGRSTAALFKDLET